MTPADARALIAHGSLSEGGPRTWADLGCGDGTFTLALAAFLPEGSTIHAVDTDRTALAAIPHNSGGVVVVPHVGDFTLHGTGGHDVDGVLMANALHYVRDQDEFLRRLVGTMKQPKLLLVEYDTDMATRWVPFPLSRKAAARRLADAGLSSVIDLGRRASVFRRADIYAVLATAG
jgi:trans-aconitate methyltransferase